MLLKNALVLLAKLQNKCLYRTIGAYKRTPQVILKHKAAVLLLDIYIDTTAIQRTATVQSHPVEEKIRQTLECIQGTRNTGATTTISGEPAPRQESTAKATEDRGPPT